MRVIERSVKTPLCIGLGFFDCVHLGHRQLLDRVKDEADSLKIKSAAVTFSNNPYEPFCAGSKVIYTYDERLTLFEKTGIDYCIPFRFDDSFIKIAKEDYLNTLINKYNAAAFICGHDYRFGYNCEGDAEFLEDFSKARGIKTAVLPPVIKDGERVSSTLIKRFLTYGDIIKANELLEEPYFMTGNVIKGRGVGKQFGFPTANLRLDKEKMLIKNGVYATQTVIDGRKYKSVTNIGPKPTFNEDSVTVETTIDMESKNLYGQKIKIEFLKFLRPVQKFDSPSDLAVQIKKDFEF